MYIISRVLYSNILNILFIRLTFKTENSRPRKDENKNLRQYERGHLRAHPPALEDRRDNDDDSPQLQYKDRITENIFIQPIAQRPISHGSDQYSK